MELTTRPLRRNRPIAEDVVNEPEFTEPMQQRPGGADVCCANEPALDAQGARPVCAGASERNCWRATFALDARKRGLDKNSRTVARRRFSRAPLQKITL